MPDFESLPSAARVSEESVGAAPVLPPLALASGDESSAARVVDSDLPDFESPPSAVRVCRSSFTSLRLDFKLWEGGNSGVVGGYCC